MDKIKCYTVSMGDGELIDTDLDNILETLRIELEENLTIADPMTYDFGIMYLTQQEIDDLPEFDGF